MIRYNCGYNIDIAKYSYRVGGVDGAGFVTQVEAERVAASLRFTGIFALARFACRRYSTHHHDRKFNVK